jgi:hypothetical protein
MMRQSKMSSTVHVTWNVRERQQQKNTGTMKHSVLDYPTIPISQLVQGVKSVTPSRIFFNK